MEIYFENHGSVRETHRTLRPFYGRHNSQSEQLIRVTMERFCTKFTLLDRMHHSRRRTVSTKETIAAVERNTKEDPNESIRHRVQQLNLCPATLWKIFAERSRFACLQNSTRARIEATRLPCTVYIR